MSNYNISVSTTLPEIMSIVNISIAGVTLQDTGCNKGKQNIYLAII